MHLREGLPLIHLRLTVTLLDIIFIFMKSLHCYGIVYLYPAATEPRSFLPFNKYDPGKCNHLQKTVNTAVKTLAWSVGIRL
jgi:hypothetical protein